jgi:serine/threonine-protein kinase
MEILYRWCAAGLVIFEVQPPSRPDAPHGPLVAWHVTSEVAAHAAALDLRADEVRTTLQRQADHLSAQLSSNPDTLLLAHALTRPHSVASLNHLVTAAQAFLDHPTCTPNAQHTDRQPAFAPADQILQRLARGSFRDYSLDGEPIAVGGQASVRRAIHKLTGTPVAYKRIRFRDKDSIARMRREIEAGMRFGDEPHVMPILDASPDYDWLVMPLASGTATTLADQLQDASRLRELVTALCEGLRRPHSQNWIHRDLKPDNVLRLHDRWAVADWGLLRRPHGQTSAPGRTHAGSLYGTEGFAAPELSVDAHQAGPPADIYSIGQIIGAILTGRSPRANIPLLPAAGPWRRVVESVTQEDPAARPSTVDELLAVLAQELDGLPENTLGRSEGLLAAIGEDREEARR